MFAEAGHPDNPRDVPANRFNNVTISAVFHPVKPLRIGFDPLIQGHGWFG